MSVKTYSLVRDEDKHLTKDFRVREFRCKDGSDKILIDTDLADLLQQIRDAFGRPVTINSAYRTPTHNKRVGGASNSQHVKGTAADIRVQGIPPFAVAAWMEQHIKSVGKHACGYYPISLFCHVDVRATKVLFQEFKKSKTRTVTSFGFGNKYESYLAKEEEMTQEQFNDMMENYLESRAQKAPHDWSEKDRKWAEENGIIQGDPDGSKRYGSFITREEAAAMIHRAVEKLEEKK